MQGTTMGAQQPSASGQDRSRESDLENLYYVFTSSAVLLVNWWQRSVTEDKDGSLRESSAHRRRRDREILLVRLLYRKCSAVEMR